MLRNIGNDRTIWTATLIPDGKCQNAVTFAAQDTAFRLIASLISSVRNSCQFLTGQKDRQPEKVASPIRFQSAQSMYNKVKFLKINWTAGLATLKFGQPPWKVAGLGHGGLLLFHTLSRH